MIDHVDLMRVAVMGAGGTGGYFGGLLARAGEDVTFIARGAHLQAMRTHGLTVKSSLAGDFTLAVKATDTPGEIGPVDMVLFCVKTYDTNKAAKLIRPLVGPDTVVFSVQNGIDNAERIGRIVGLRSVICAAAQISSVIEAPGVVAHKSGGVARLLFGELDGNRSTRTQRLLDTFQHAGIEAELRPNIKTDLWDKFLFICGASGVTSLTRLPIGLILACPETRALIRGTLEEVEAVARANDVALPADCVDRKITSMGGLQPGIYGSMYYDLVAGRQLEVEVLNGKVVDLGRQYGVPTPNNFAIYAALKPYASGAPALPE